MQVVTHAKLLLQGSASSGKPLQKNCGKSSQDIDRWPTVSPRVAFLAVLVEVCFLFEIRPAVRHKPSSSH